MTVTLLVKVIVVHWIRAWHGGHGIVVVAVTGRSRLLSEGWCNRAGAGAAVQARGAAGSPGGQASGMLAASSSSSDSQMGASISMIVRCDLSKKVSDCGVYLEEMLWT